MGNSTVALTVDERPSSAVNVEVGLGGPGESSEPAPLSASSHSPGRSGWANDHRHESSPKRQSQFVACLALASGFALVRLRAGSTLTEVAGHKQSSSLDCRVPSAVTVGALVQVKRPWEGQRGMASTPVPGYLSSLA